MNSKDRFAWLHNKLITTCEKSAYTTGTTLNKVNLLLSLTGQLLDVIRVSVWSYNRDKSMIICRSLYVRDEDQYQSGITLSIDDFPNYFEAMARNRVVVANNAREHSATRKFTESYLRPLGIYSMVDAPIYSSGDHHGVLCIEDANENRDWSVEEISFITAVADKISLALEHEAWLKASESLVLAQRIDPLTGLENRQALQERIEEYLQSTHQAPKDEKGGILIVGMDGFSKINDELGYMQANELLQLIAEKLSQLNSANHLFPARLSGDLFALWILGIDEAELRQVIKSIQLIMADGIRLASGKCVNISACIGGTLVSGGANDSENPIRQAEIALAKAKEKGMGSDALYDDRWFADYRTRQDAESEFIAALGNEELLPYYQPIVDSQSGKIAGVEALVRWQHPAKGVLSPQHFLPLATEMGVMSQLGEMMLHAVCKDMGQYAQLQALSWVSVNLSTEQLYSTALVSLVARLLSRYKVPRNLLELEIVEDIIIHDTKLATDQLNELNKLGVKFSIDDFGTGYSSLSRLKHLPVSKLKIDRSFVDGLPDDESDCCIASSIVGMAKGLNLQIVAEGVETQSQAHWLREIQCDCMQGYLYAKPMPIKQLLAFIDATSD